MTTKGANLPEQAFSEHIIIAITFFALHCQRLEQPFDYSPNDLFPLNSEELKFKYLHKNFEKPR